MGRKVSQCPQISLSPKFLPLLQHFLNIKSLWVAGAHSPFTCQWQQENIKAFFKNVKAFRVKREGV